MALYRKKPVVIEAMQWTGNNRRDIFEFCPDAQWRDNTGMEIYTLEGHLHASEHDWIIKGVKGEFYPCKPDIFEATYELAEE